ncbi:MAG: transposase, partial [Formivibrio sp.]|nr:transposase [Formivibrio sp.]
MKSQKWNIKPTAEQKALLRLWFDAARLVYNKGVEHANDTGDTSLGGMRAATGIDDNIWKREAPKRLQDCIPYEIRDSALQDLNKAAATLRAKARKRGEKGKHVKYKFRTRKSGTESITLRKRQLNCKSNRGDVWPALFGTTHDRSAMATERGKVLPSVFECDTRLLHDMRTGAYYLCIPMPINRATTPETQGPVSIKDRVVSIDPGVRTFATCYDPAGELTEWGVDAGKQLFELKKRADAVDRAANAKHGRQRTRTHRVAAKLRQRGRDLVNELHRKLALWLCKEHQTILLPEYQTQGMMKKKDKTVKRRISRTTCGRMSGLSFYKFKQFLEHKAQELGSELI